jgi:asparagine synthase (glutamine-hydrolysing)
MSLFLAAVSMNGHPLPPGVKKQVLDALEVAGSATICSGERAALAYRDLGFWSGPSVHADGDDVTVFGGDPVVCHSGTALPRSQALEIFGASEAWPDSNLLRSSHGTFCGLRVDLQAGRLTAFTDKMGVRPVYFSKVAGVMFVASAQWLLEAVPGATGGPDWRGVVETAAFGYAHEDRTVFEGIRVLCPGQALTVSSKGQQFHQYWDWADVAENATKDRDCATRVKQAFDQAVDDRIQGQKRVFAFLSGGMDSRLIVSRLRERGVAVSTMNFAPHGSQDLEFGRLAATAMGTDHFEFDGTQATFTDRQVAALLAWRAAHPDKSQWPEQPSLIWSGDGGSVGLGHVYLDEAIVHTALRGDVAETAREIQAVNRLVISRRMFTRGSAHLAEIPLKAIAADLSRRPKVDAARNCHLFFMLNDQRRHLFSHFETIHRSGIELVLPFFDGRFVESVLSSPVQPFLLHGLYNDLMRKLPFGLGGVPWQAYPGHVPCPVPIPGNLRRQWEEGWFSSAQMRSALRRRSVAAMRETLSPTFPSGLLSRPKILWACLLGCLGVDRFEHVIRGMKPFIAASRTNTPISSPPARFVLETSVPEEASR